MLINFYYNKINNIIPRSTSRKIEETIENQGSTKNKKDNNLLEESSIIDLKKRMLEYAENLDFEKAAEIRDKIKILEKKEMGISENL